MKIHEYQAKELFRKYGVPVPRAKRPRRPTQALAAAEKLGYPCVIKAQVHAGGRGKAGGIKLARNRSEAETDIAEILGMTLVSHQTGPEGQTGQKTAGRAGTEHPPRILPGHHRRP